MQRKQFFSALTVVLLFLVACKKEEAAYVEINFENKTGTSFQNTFINDRFVGDLANGSSTGFLKFNQFYLTYGNPEPERFMGKIAENTNLIWRSVTCGPEQKKELQKGRYTVVITQGYFTGTTNTYLEFSFK